MVLHTDTQCGKSEKKSDTKGYQVYNSVGDIYGKGKPVKKLNHWLPGVRDGGRNAYIGHEGTFWV